MKKFCFILLMMFIPFIIIAQINVSITNQKTIGGANIDSFKDAIQTKDGGFLLAVDSKSDMTFDKTDSLIGFYDWWIIKLDNNLNIEWQETIGSFGADLIQSIIECEDGYLLAGRTRDSLATGDKTVTNYGGYDAWVVKIDMTGQIQWQKVLGGTGNDRIVSMIKEDNTIYAAGWSDSDSSGTKTQNCRGETDGWIMALDLNGNIKWDKTIGGMDWDWRPDIALNNNKIFMAMESSSDSAYEKSEDSYGSKDSWIVCLDTSGNLLWDRTLGGIDSEVLTKINIHGDTLIVSSASSSGKSGNKNSIRFGNSSLYPDNWVKYMDMNGNILSHDTVYGGLESDVPSDVITNEDNNIILASTSQSGISGNKNVEVSSSSTGADFWIMEIRPDGQIIWQNSFGGNNTEFLEKVIQPSANNYVLFGTSESDASFDKTGFNRGEYDVWIVELSTDVGVEEKYSSGFSLFPNPTNGKVNIKLDKTRQNIRLRLLTTTGQLIEQRQYENRQKIRYEKNGLSPGLYLLELKTGNKPGVTKKLLVK